MKSLLSIACVLLAAQVYHAATPPPAIEGADLSSFTSAKEVYEAMIPLIEQVMAEVTAQDIDIGDFIDPIAEEADLVAKTADDYINDLINTNRPKVQAMVDRYVAALVNATKANPECQTNYQEQITTYNSTYTSGLVACGVDHLSVPVMQSAQIDYKFIRRKAIALRTTVIYAMSKGTKFGAQVISIGQQELYDVIRLFRKITWASQTSAYIACLQMTVVDASTQRVKLNNSIKTCA